MKDILIVEDNKEIAKLLGDFLEADGYSVDIAKTGEQAMHLFEEQAPRLVILDIMLPGMDGFSVCQKIREKNNTPVIIVSARTEKDDKLNGLILGADDYMEKPYDIDILLAKIRGIFRRRYETAGITEGNLKLDKARMTVSRDGAELPMTTKEFELLWLLMENKGKTLKKEWIFNQIWGVDSFSELQTLTVHIKWLRQKIEKDPANPARIVTVWGVGYRFE